MVLGSLPLEHPGRADLERIIHQIDRVSTIVRHCSTRYGWGN